MNQYLSDGGEDPTLPFIGLNALEIAAVADAKKFLGQCSIQEIVTDIWNGDFIFWNSMSVHTIKKAQKYRPRYVDAGTSVNRLFTSLQALLRN